MPDKTRVRIQPLTPPYSPEIDDALKRWMPPGSGAEPLTLFRTLVIHDELFARMRRLGAGILAHGRTDPRQREIIIHRTCTRAGAELIITAGWYRMLSYVINSAGVQAEPWAARFPAA